MPVPNADKARDPMVSNSSADASYSTDSSRDAAMVDIPMAPATIAAMKKADPHCTIGSASDDAGLLDEAVREGNEEY